MTCGCYECIQKISFKVSTLFLEKPMRSILRSFFLLLSLLSYPLKASCELTFEFDNGHQNSIVVLTSEKTWQARLPDPYRPLLELPETNSYPMHEATLFTAQGKPKYPQQYSAFSWSHFQLQGS